VHQTDTKQWEISDTMLV